MRTISRSTTHCFSPTALALLTLVLGTTACSSGDDSGGGSSAGTISGTLALVPPSMPLVEIEPNDAVDEPQPVGELAPGGSITIRGSIGEGEGFDGFAFVAPQRVHVVAELRFAANTERRVELAAYDPLAMGVVARADASRRVAFTAAGAFDLVVRSAQGAGDYELVVRAVAAPTTIASSGWIGTLVTGDDVRVGADAAGRYELTSAEAFDLRIAAVGEVGVSRTTRTGDSQPVIVEDGAASVFHVEPLERVVVTTSAGGTAALTATPRTETTPLRADPERLLATERERADLGLASGDVIYGRAPSNAKAGEVLVKPRVGSDLEGDLSRRGLSRVDRIGEDVLQVAADLGAIVDENARARTTVALVRSLGASPRVEYAELNRLRRAYGGVPPFTPNDGFIGLQWHYPLIRLPEAWGEVRNFVTAPGPDVLVGVIDTGRRPHVDLDGNTLVAGYEYDFISSASSAGDGNGPDSNAFDEGDGQGLIPSSYHGTHVAGTIAAVSDNGVGVAGVGSVPIGTPTAVSRVKVVHLRVLGKDGGTDADIARAIRYAAGLQNPGYPLIATQLDIVNMSLGGPGSSASVQNAVNAARNNQVTIFAAAGNENSSVPSYPAAYTNVISVAAVDHNSVRAPYSNFHPSVDLCAPGGDTSVDTDGDGYADGVLSTLINGMGTGNYVFYQGTSMACPHAAGLAALMKVVSPNLLSATIEADLIQSATDLGAVGKDNIYGYGLINALRAVQIAGTGIETTPVLGANPTVLNFAPDTSVLPLSLVNLGGATVDVTTYTDDQPWLTLMNGGPAQGIDIGSLLVTVDRTHRDLELDGTYSATISVASTNGGSVDVPVNVVVARPFLPDVDLFVLAVDYSVDPPITVAQAIVNPAFDGLEYVLDELSTIDGLLLPGGYYLVVCGSDDDNDGFICGDGDTYCGLYPTTNEPALVRVNGPVSGVDFVVGPLESVEPLTAAPGFSRRRPVQHAPPVPSARLDPE